jgi:hypothetical protein
VCRTVFNTAEGLEASPWWVRLPRLSANDSDTGTRTKAGSSSRVLFSKYPDHVQNSSCRLSTIEFWSTPQCPDGVVCPSNCVLAGLMLLTATLGNGVNATERHALLIGIGQYPHITPLEGPRNDVAALGELLTNIMATHPTRYRPCSARKPLAPAYFPHLTHCKPR